MNDVPDVMRRYVRLTVILICICVIGYELVLTNYGYHAGVCVFLSLCIAACGTVMVLAPVIGSAITLAVFVLASIMQAPLPLPLVGLLMVACMMVTYWQVAIGIFATTAMCVVGVCNIQTVSFGMPDVKRAYVYAAAALIAIGAGLALRVWRRQHELLEHAREAASRRRVARTLHDRVANDINDIIMMVEHQLESQEESMSDARLELLNSRARHALAGVRRAIVELEASEADMNLVADAPRERGQAEHDLCVQATRYHEGLLDSGFQGELLILNKNALRNVRSQLADDLLRELFGNITRYADKHHDYCVILSCTQTHLGVGVTDVIRDPETCEHGLGTGLRALHNRVEERGGTLDVELDGAYWNCQVSVPLT
ncbi:hypothetical protein [Bifidobacterium pseudolongum]|nr:hypothetical protein [Bifidobacterium pseudolongum]